MNRRLLFLISLTIVCFVTFSSAVFGYGFTSQYNPKVDGLKFTVATQEHIVVSDSGMPGTFHDSLSFTDLVTNSVELVPVEAVKASENAMSFIKGGNAAVANSHYIKLELYFYASNDMNVYLEGTGSGTIIDSISNGIADATQMNKIRDSLRVGFLSYNTVETPVGGEIETTYTPNKVNIYSVNAKTNDSYTDGLKYETFTNIGYTEGIENDVVLLEVSANKVSKLDVYIWLEAKDKNCVSNVMSSVLRVNLGFLGVKTEEAGS